MSLPGAKTGTEAVCAYCGEWSRARLWERVDYDTFECPLCGEETGPLDVPPVRRERASHVE